MEDPDIFVLAFESPAQKLEPDYLLKKVGHFNLMERFVWANQLDKEEIVTIIDPPQKCSMRGSGSCDAKQARTGRGLDGHEGVEREIKG